MDWKGILIAVIVGAVAGWLAGLLMGKRKSLFMNIIIGIIGGAVGSWLFSTLGISIGIGGILGEREGIKFIFHTREKDLHNIPHIHCEYSGEEFRVNLYTLEIMDDSFKSRKKTKLAMDVVTKIKMNLLEYGT